MIRNPIDVAARVSPSLSALIQSRANDPDAEQPITLASVRDFMAGLLPTTIDTVERLHHFDIGDSIFDELDALIEHFGDDSLAEGYLRYE